MRLPDEMMASDMPLRVPTIRALAFSVPIALLFVLAGCQSGSVAGKADGELERKPSDRKLAKRKAAKSRSFYLGSKETQASIARDIEALATASPDQHATIHRRLVGRGEASVPKLMKALTHQSPRIRMRAAYSLGRLNDVRSFDALAAAQRDTDPAVAFEAATALARCKDDRGLPLLIRGLSHAKATTRARCMQVLNECTGETFGFVANDRLEDREAAIARWQGWLDRRRYELYDHHREESESSRAKPGASASADADSDGLGLPIAPRKGPSNQPVDEPPPVVGYGSPDGDG